MAEFEPDSPVYNTSTTRLITGTINITALEKSVNEIIKRHKSLRTRFSTLLEQPVQIIEPSLYIALETIDLTHLSEMESRQKSVELITQVANKAFDLSKLPLIRVMLFLLSKESAVLLLSTHHIVSDAWSINIFLQELCSFYQGFISGQLPSFDPLPIQYVDYALWQRDRLSGEVLEKEFKYWEKKLSGIKPLHSLPIDKPRPTNQTHHGRRQQIIVSKELSQKIVSLSKKASTTLFMTMLASFKLLLYRYSGELDIIVGSPIAGRNHPETEGLIGFFLNTLILRTSFSANDSFLELLEKVRETCLEAYTHQEIPFEKLVELNQPERSLSYSPIFQVMFLLQEDNLST
ncbi:MAG: amino acid adenylation domain protein, partial [bacterium]